MSLLKRFRKSSKLKAYYKFIRLTIKNRAYALPPRAQSVIVRENYQYTTDNHSDDDSWKSYQLLFSTSQGVFLFNQHDKSIQKILNGKYYGITRFHDWWILARSNMTLSSDKKRIKKAHRQSDVCAVKIDHAGVSTLKYLLWGLPGEIHQMDVIDDILYIPHTGFNQLLLFDLHNINTQQRPYHLAHCKTIALDIHSPSHLNSVFHCKRTNRIYVIAHNSTAHTNIPSDIIEMNRNGSEMTIHHTKAHSAHNIYCNDQGLIYCDSNNCNLMLNDIVLFRSNMLLRGLAVTDKLFFVGGSEIDIIGAKRTSSDSSIYILSQYGKLIARHRFKKLGNLYEIRIYNDHDYALSLSNPHIS